VNRLDFREIRNLHRAREESQGYFQEIPQGGSRDPHEKKQQTGGISRKYPREVREIHTKKSSRQHPTPCTQPPFNRSG